MTSSTSSPKPTVLADTNVVSELFRPRPNPGVRTWSEGVTVIAISVVTLEEIGFGLAWKPNPRIRALFEKLVATTCEVLPVTPPVAQLAGQLRGDLMARGRVRSQADMLIAATAQVHQLTLVSRNVRDFSGLSVPLVNPFT